MHKIDIFNSDCWKFATYKRIARKLFDNNEFAYYVSDSDYIGDSFCIATLENKLCFLHWYYNTTEDNDVVLNINSNKDINDIRIQLYNNIQIIIHPKEYFQDYFYNYININKEISYGYKKFFSLVSLLYKIEYPNKYKQILKEQIELFDNALLISNDVETVKNLYFSNGGNSNAVDNCLLNELLHPIRKKYNKKIDIIESPFSIWTFFQYLIVKEKTPFEVALKMQYTNI